VQKKSGVALFNLVESYKAIAAAGGIDVLTAAMRAHPAAETVQLYCGAALRCLEQ
jgi:hypothetical protein